MSTLEQAAREALEVLKRLQGGCTDSDDGTVEAITVWCPEVIDALRAALAPVVTESVTAAEPVAWHGLTEGERNQAVQSICEYGTGFVAPLFAVIEGVERTLERRNAPSAAPPAPAVQPSDALVLAVTDLANLAYQHGREELSPWPEQWQKLEARILALAANPAPTEGEPR